MKKIREINRRNNTLKRKYKGDERFVRIHKRIEEENERRERPIISRQEYEIAEKLMQMKRTIDDKLYLNVNVLSNEEHFRRDVLANVSTTLINLAVNATLEERKFIRTLISDEYLNQFSAMSSAQYQRM